MTRTIKTELRLPKHAGDQKLTEMEGCHKNDVERPVNLRESTKTGNEYGPDGIPLTKSDNDLEQREEEEGRQYRTANNDLGPFPFGKARCVDKHAPIDTGGSPR